jgi:hypothetical protein
MKKTFQIFFVLILLLTITNAQTVYVADSVTEDNEPINAHNYWEIDPWGKSLYIILDYENETVEGNIVYLFIDKFVDGTYQPFDSKSINVDADSKRVKYDYTFTETGKFKLYFINISQKKIASVVVTLSAKAAKKQKTMKRSNYYDNVSLVFCEKVLVGGTTLGIKKRTSLRENNGIIYVKLTNFSPLKTDVILVDIWRKEHRSFEYDEYIESKKFRIDPEWKDTFFKYKFPKTGEYKIVIYNQEEVLIKTGYIDVLN